MVDLTNLRDRWSRLQQAQPRLRIRDAAAELGVTEAALVSSRTGDGVLRLRNEPAAIVEQLHRLGHTMALTRNEYAVSETFGPYSDVSINGHMGVVLDPAIDLRLFLNHWHHVWAVETESQGRRLRSFQFFDAYGDAVHKVYPKTDEGVEAFYALCEEFRHPEQEPVLTFAPRPVTPAEKPDSAVDVDAFQAGWRALEDTHHFYGLTRRHGVSRTQALRLAPPEMVTEVDVSAVTRMLKGAAEAAVPIMVFIGSRGCIQIFTGRVEQISDRSSLPVGAAEQGGEPAERRVGVALQHQQAQALVGWRMLRHFRQPVTQQPDMVRRIIHDDQRGRIPAPTRQVLLVAEPAQLAPCHEARAPARSRPRLGKLQRKPCLAAPAPLLAGQHTDADRRC